MDRTTDHGGPSLKFSPDQTDITTTVRGESLWLLPERAVFWPSESTLLIADPHFGKAATFRASGMPLPEMPTDDDLHRLSGALDRTHARQLIVLGDLIHARVGRSSVVLDAVTRWRARHGELECLLVRGNHDRSSGDPPASWRFECRDEPETLGPFALRHHPVSDAKGEQYTLAGHLHPAVVLRGGGDRFRGPCFWFGESLAILPAFGSLTGCADVKPRSRDQVFVIADGAVLRI
jgi:DNA ligase-associated metallophosphoesterase